MGNKTGSLRVLLDVDSYFLKNSLNVDVWDSDLQHCASIQEGQRLDLPEGIYQVSAVLADGGSHKKIVEIKEQQLSEVKLESTSPMVLGRSLIRNPLLIGGGFEKSIDDFLSSPLKGLPASESGAEELPQIEEIPQAWFPQLDGLRAGLFSEVSVLSTEGARLVNSSGNRFMFEPDEMSLEKLACATIQVEDSLYKVSLPLNRETYSGKNDCTLEVFDQGPRKRLYARFGARRTVSYALQNMLNEGYLLQASEVAVEATELLRGKYRDPTGAALGALLLNKSGRLKTRRDWLENLARDFPWIPDGKVLLANILIQKEADSENSLKLALEASRDTMLFTESFSILLHMLRNWPWPVPDQLSEEYRSVLMRLSLQSASVDWSASTLTQRLSVLGKEPTTTFAVQGG